MFHFFFKKYFSTHRKLGRHTSNIVEKCFAKKIVCVYGSYTLYVTLEESLNYKRQKKKIEGPDISAKKLLMYLILRN